jgi:HEAT repeat protein
MRTVLALTLLASALPALAQSPEADWDKEVKAMLEKAVSDNAAEAIVAQDEIREIGRPAVPALRAALKDERAYVRFFAADLLGDIHDPAAAPDLVVLLDDLKEEKTGEPVAAAAARALGKLGDAGAADKLIEKLDSTDINVRYEAARALGNLRVKKAEAKLLEIAKKKETAESYRGGLVTAAAVEALGRLKSRAALPFILEDMLQSTTPEQRSGWTYDQIAIMAATRITGEDFGTFEATKKEETVRKWKEWWAKQAPPKEPPPETPK